MLSSISLSASALDVTQDLINPYYYCVGRVTGRQPDRFQNPDAAVERAFTACQTEELAIRSYGEMNNLSAAEINLVIATQRGRLKRYLSEQLQTPTKKKKQCRAGLHDSAWPPMRSASSS